MLVTLEAEAATLDQVETLAETSQASVDPRQYQRQMFENLVGMYQGGWNSVQQPSTQD